MRLVIYIVGIGIPKFFNWTIAKSDVLLSICAGSSVFQILEVPPYLNILLNIPDDFIKLLFSLLTTFFCTIVAFYTKKKLEHKSNKTKKTDHE